MRLFDLRTPLPPVGVIDHPDVMAAVEKFVGLYGAAEEAVGAELEAEQGLAAATERDADAYAAALAAGKPDPGPKALERASANRDRARRYTEAALRAGALARSALEATVAEHRPELEGALFARELAAQRTFGEAVRAAGEAHAERVAASAAAAWARRFPEPSKPAAAVTTLVGMKAQNGEPYHAAAALAALRELAGEPEPAAAAA